MKRIVIIAGSGEARALARALPEALVVLPEAERVARSWDNALLRGPLTAADLHAWGAVAVVEAAHPCDAGTAFAAARASANAGVPHLQLVRPGWRAGHRDRWVPLRRASDAVRVIPRGARVLVTTGREVLPELRALRAEVLMRRIGNDCAPLPLWRGRMICGAGPFTVADEIRLLRRERIDWLMVHDAGGPGGWPKLAAARALQLPVALVARPRRPGGPRVATVKEALAWLETQR
ncbi:precorrin-6A/cobalt-precorrin-6A reductase [Mameliella sediminis]|uniref:precorrin-6A/cobalt-precorrin-6A reductase n=1 Tax=Mameliella sediminis TaxID=2836866 RepID=UPI001C46443F|nr:precorrin-6A/cobalt-precorrin-6A reductase [Mameliella sediminis]MBV7393686.1 precorrin-6A/cobalt-precorrin-6A reductase [Mameliella sediminis]